MRYPTAATVNILSHCLYTLFSSGPRTYMFPFLSAQLKQLGLLQLETTLGPMREACLGYFKLGGICASGPMGLLSM